MLKANLREVILMYFRLVSSTGKIILSVIVLVMGVLLTFFMLYIIHSHKEKADYSGVVKNATVISPSSISVDNQMVKFRSSPDRGAFLKSKYATGDFLEIMEERYILIQEEDSDGEKKLVWNPSGREVKKAESIVFGNVTVKLQGAWIRGKREKIAVLHRKEGFKGTRYDDVWVTGEPGKGMAIGWEKKVLEGIYVSKELTVTGIVRGGTIENGSPFIVTGETMDELAENLKKEQINAYIGIKFGSVLMIFMGLLFLSAGFIGIISEIFMFLSPGLILQQCSWRLALLIVVLSIVMTVIASVSGTLFLTAEIIALIISILIIICYYFLIDARRGREDI